MIQTLPIALFIFLMNLPTQVMSQDLSDDLDIGQLIQPLPAKGIFRDSTYYNWGASILKTDDGTYHLFYSRWKRDYTFSGWLIFSEICHAVSDNPVGPWTYKETVLQGRGKGYWDEFTAHNPKIKYFDGKYYLYYISTNAGGKNFSDRVLRGLNNKTLKNNKRRLLRENQRVGVAMSNSINGPWQRLDEPLLEPSGPITTLTVNPAIDKGKDGNYYLVVKGDRPNEKRFLRNQVIAISKSPVGPFTIQPDPLIGDLDTEDVSIWFDSQRSRFYAVFHAHTFIGLMTSTDGIKWEKAKNYVITEKKLLLEDGTFLIPDRMERPLVYLEDNIPKVLCLALKKGDDSYTIFLPLKSGH